MNVKQLYDALALGFERGLHPETTVVISADQDCLETADWLVLDTIRDPTDPAELTLDGPAWIWFSLFPGDSADPRWTPEHYVPLDPPVDCMQCFEEGKLGTAVIRTDDGYPLCSDHYDEYAAAMIADIVFIDDSNNA